MEAVLVHIAFEKKLDFKFKERRMSVDYDYYSIFVLKSSESAIPANVR